MFLIKTNRSKVHSDQFTICFAQKSLALNTPKGGRNLYLFDRNHYSSLSLTEDNFHKEMSCTQHTEITFCMGKHTQTGQEFVHFGLKPTDLKLPQISWWYLLHGNVLQLHTTQPVQIGICTFLTETNRSKITTDQLMMPFASKCLAHNMPKGGRKLCILTETNRSKVSPCQLKMPFAWKYHAHNTPKGDMNLFLFFTKTNWNKFSTGQLKMPFAQKISCTQHTQRWYKFVHFYF